MNAVHLTNLNTFSLLFSTGHSAYEVPGPTRKAENGNPWSSKFNLTSAYRWPVDGEQRYQPSKALDCGSTA